MSTFKEIVTKAIIGKCKKNNSQAFEIECEQKPNTILGCWVINHKFNGINNNGKVILNGNFDVNVWYSYDNDTKTAVTTKNISYSDTLNVNLKNDTKIDNTSEIIVECLKQPTVTDVNIKNNLVDVKVEKELGVEIIGNTTVKIAVEDDYDDYEEIIDTNEDEININVDELDDNFIVEKK